MAASDRSQPNLKTWKEICSYLDVSVRTAQKWEIERGLPIRRLTGNKSHVWADPAELDQWKEDQQKKPSNGQSEEASNSESKLGNSQAGAERGEATAPRSDFVSLYPRHLALCCIVYALLFVLDLFLEIAYRFDEFGRSALFAAPFLAVWIAGTSAVGLWSDWKAAKRNVRGGFAVMTGIYISSGLLAWFLLSSFLPSEPVTLLNFPGQTAQAAFLKNVLLYFLPMAVIALLVPYHYMVGRSSAGTSDGRLYIPASWLASGVLAVGIASFFLTQSLIRNLRPTSQTNLFMQLAVAKSSLYFAFGMLSVAWYVRALGNRSALQASN